jgi:hypothetical protein
MVKSACQNRAARAPRPCGRRRDTRAAPALLAHVIHGTDHGHVVWHNRPGLRAANANHQAPSRGRLGHIDVRAEHSDLCVLPRAGNVGHCHSDPDVHPARSVLANATGCFAQHDVQLFPLRSATGKAWIPGSFGRGTGQRQIPHGIDRSFTRSRGCVIRATTGPSSRRARPAPSS